MKKIIPDYLHHRLPANKNFLQYVDEEMHNYLIALCASLYPNSETKAYILWGCVRTASLNVVNYSQGVIFYNNEMFFVPSFSHSSIGDYSPGLVFQTEEVTEEYGSGDTLPAYKVGKLTWGLQVFDMLSFDSLIRVDFYKRDILNNTSTFFTKKGAKEIANCSTQTIIIHLKLLHNTSGTNTTIALPSEFSKIGFLGYAKVANKTSGGVFDLLVYKISGTIVFTLPSGNEITNSSQLNAYALKWSELYQHINFQPGDDVTLYINLTHERV